MDDKALRRGNASLALVHAAQAVVILALSTDFSLPVTGAFMEGPPGSGLPKQDLLFDLRIGLLAQSAGTCADALAAVRARLHRWRRGVDRDRGADRRLGGALDNTADVRLCATSLLAWQVFANVLVL